MIIKRKTDFGLLLYNTRTNKLVLLEGNKILRDDVCTEILKRERYPLKCKFYITSRCNSKCFYCYTSGSMLGTESDTNKIIKIIDKVYSQGVMIIEIIGGEPFVRSDIFDILNHISTMNIGVCLFTNATLIDKSSIVKLADLNNLSLISTTLFSMEPEKHDKFSGNKGSHKKTMDFLLNAKSAGINVRCNVPLTKFNIHELKQFYTFFKNQGIKAILSSQIHPNNITGEAFQLPVNELSNAIADFTYASNIHANFSPPNCSNGTYGFSINAEGFLIGCDANMKSYGNILDNDLNALLRSNDYLRDNIIYDEECETCNVKQFCTVCPQRKLRYKRTNDKNVYCEYAYSLFKSFKQRGVSHA